jgi:hypothetical protein
MPWWVSTPWLLQISQFPHGFLCNLSIHSDHLASDCECLPSLHYQLSCLLSFFLHRGSLCLIMSLCSRLLIQVDISGHPPFPTISKQFFGNFGNLLFLTVFQLLKLPELFWRPKQCFFGKQGATWNFLRRRSHKSCIPRIDISNEVLSVSNRDHMKKLSP